MAVAGPDSSVRVQWARVTRESSGDFGVDRPEAPPARGRLPAERTLADILGVGRPTMREALRVTEAMGLLVVRPGEGTDQPAPRRCRPPSGESDLNRPGDLLSLSELRMAASRARPRWRRGAARPRRSRRCGPSCPRAR